MGNRHSTLVDAEIKQLQEDLKKAGEKLERDEQAWQAKLDLLNQVEEADMDKINKKLDEKAQEMKQYTDKQADLLQKIEEAETEQVKIQLEKELKTTQETMDREAADWRGKMEKDELIRNGKLDLVANELQREITASKVQFQTSMKVLEVKLQQQGVGTQQVAVNQRRIVTAVVPCVILQVILLFLVVSLFQKRKPQHQNGEMRPLLQ